MTLLTYAYVCTYVYIRTYVHMYTFVRMYICIHTYVHSRAIQSGTAAWMTQCPELLQCHPGTAQATATVDGEATQSQNTKTHNRQVTQIYVQCTYVQRELSAILAIMGQGTRYIKKSNKTFTTCLLCISAYNQQPYVHVDQ